MFVFLIIICILLLAYQAHSFLHIPFTKAALPSGTRVHTITKSQRLQGEQALTWRSRASRLSMPTLYSNMKDIPAWDKYGRVPYDDWLFTTSRLTEPNLFKRSFVEAVNQEMPIVVASFDRRMAAAGRVGAIVFATCFMLVVVHMYRMAMAVVKSPKVIQVREEAVRGFQSAVGVYRKVTDGGADDDDEGAAKRRRRGGGSGRRRGGGGYDDDEDEDFPWGDDDDD